MANENEESPYFQLVLKTDADLGVSKLELKGPKIPGTEESPVIAIYRSGKKYVLEIGVGEHTVEAGEIPDELRAFFGGRSKTGKSGPQPVPVPSKAQLKRGDDSYMPYHDYNMRVSTEAAKKSGGTSYHQQRGKVWTPLPKPLYDWLVKCYRQQEMLELGPLYL